MQKAVLDIDPEAERMSKMDVISKDVPITDDNLINEDLSCSRPEDVEGRYLILTYLKKICIHNYPFRLSDYSYFLKVRNNFKNTNT